MIGATRIHGTGWREAIDVAHSVIGRRIMSRLGHVQYVCGVDPLFAGLHAYDVSYRDTAHCCYPHHLDGPADRRVTTVVMPNRVGPWTAHIIVHELGHALDQTIGFGHTATPVTEYAKTNRQEAFAEAFTSWRWPGNGYERPDDATLALFGGLL